MTRGLANYRNMDDDAEYYFNIFEKPFLSYFGNSGDNDGSELEEM